MSRSAWKPLFIHPLIHENLMSSSITLQNRATTITKKIVGKTFNIYNGIIWYSVQVTDEIKAQSFGQFAPTRIRLSRKRPKIKTKK